MSSQSQDLYSLDWFKVDIININRYANQGRIGQPDYHADQCDIDSVIDVLTNHLDFLNADCEAEFLRHQLARFNQTYGKFDYQHCALWRKYLELAGAKPTDPEWDPERDQVTIVYYQFVATITEAATLFDFGLGYYQEQADLLEEFVAAAKAVVAVAENRIDLTDFLWLKAQVKRLEKALVDVRMELDN